MQSINNSTELNNSTLASSELQDNRSNAPVVKLCAIALASHAVVADLPNYASLSP